MMESVSVAVCRSRFGRIMFLRETMVPIILASNVNVFGRAILTADLPSTIVQSSLKR